MAQGKVYLVGAGPGDPGLLTLKGLRCIEQAQVIVYDALVNPVILSHASRKAELLFVGKSSGLHSTPQEKINELLIRLCRLGRIVVRLKGGDPFVFGRGAEEALALSRARIPFEVVPGVTSVFAVPAYAGIPITHRKYCSTLTVVTGHEHPLKKGARVRWRDLLKPHSTAIILMGMENLESIVRKLLRTPASSGTPVAVISNGTTAEQRAVVGTLRDIVSRVKQRGLKSPAVIVLGEVVKLRNALKWFDPQPPLRDEKILVTRPAGQTAEFKQLLEAKGATVITASLVKIVPSREIKKIDAIVGNIQDFDWVVVSSVNGVDRLMSALKRNKIGQEKLQRIKWSAIGPKTADRLRCYGLRADLVPEEFRQELLAEELLKKGRRRLLKVLIAGAEESREFLVGALRKNGHEVEKLPLYRTQPLPKSGRRLRKLCARRAIDVVTLTSSSCVRAFASMLGRSELKRLCDHAIIAVLGPICARDARKLGIRVDVMPERYTIEDLTESIVRYFSQNREKAP